MVTQNENLLKNKIAPVAQLDRERTATNREVGGSNPSRGTRRKELYAIQSVER